MFISENELHNIFKQTRYISAALYPSAHLQRIIDECGPAT